MLNRATHTQRVRELLDVSPVVALLGARQVGKTTLARQIATDTHHHWLSVVSLIEGVADQVGRGRLAA